MPGRFKKFTVQHYAKGEIDPDECFVLIPERDPAACVAMRAYARATTDTLLAAELVSWADRIEGIATIDRDQEPLFMGRIRTWTAVLAREVKEGRMSIERALQRIAGHTACAVTEVMEDE